ncbi:MAG TPA: glycerophosphodiester phosphodiesterase [Oscillatoriales cyanobacterium M59_W2019_021]|nr:glycerophosphodiester phosphodiesterase [Oscillatoriales cyanobacterium M4454_W2019_049]HIK53290.1 glycerophosphodiester phosphodiesterase [Oscillatoriales cyanobacterium M59_W2019_021]
MQNLERSTDKNSWEKIEIIAHRGYSAIAPENTLPAFDAALQSGAHSVELDVQLSADGVPVTFHDITLDRLAGISGSVSDLTVSQLQQLDVGSHFSDRYIGTRIPTLSEVLDCLQTLDRFLYLDLKPHCSWSIENLQVLVDLLLSTGWENRCFLCSFSETILDLIREITRQFSIGYSVETAEKYAAKLELAAADGNAVTIAEYRIFLDRPQWVQIGRDRGVEAVVWTVDDPLDWQRLTDIGIRRIITNALLNK